MNIQNKADNIAKEFAVFEDWLDKYSHIIDLGKELPVLDEKYRSKQYLISGCQSQVWIYAQYKDGKVYFEADSDALITKGIVAILIRVMSDSRPDEILENDMNFIENIGLREHLSPTRSNGLNGMIKQMKLYAMAFKAKETIK